MKKLTKKQINDVRSRLDKLSDMFATRIGDKTFYGVELGRDCGPWNEREYLTVYIRIADPDKTAFVYDSENAFWRVYYASNDHEHDIAEIDKRIAEATEFVNQHYPDEHH